MSPDTPVKVLQLLKDVWLSSQTTLFIYLTVDLISGQKSLCSVNTREGASCAVTSFSFA